MTKDIEREAFKLEMMDDYNMREVDTPFGKDFAMGSTKQAFKVWQAAKAQAVPEGFVVVPEEPTERMLDSAYSSISDNLHYADLENIYRAMIWSAQEPAND